MDGEMDLDPSEEQALEGDVEERLRLLEARNHQLRDQRRSMESDLRQTASDRQRLDREVRHLRAELEKLKAPPLVVGFVKDILEDGRLVLKSSAGPHFVVRVAEFVDRKQLTPGCRVGLNQQTLSVVSVLPRSLDPVVYGCEVIEAPDVRFEDIGGLHDELRELREAVELPLLRPELFKQVGIEPPKGILLHGPPGTGKTLMAKAVAASTDAVFIRIVGSELVQKYIGEGARLVRELFQLATEKAPAIIFIDELDAIGSSRYEASTSGDREVQRTLMQLLAELDGFEARGDVKVIGATNRIDMLDAALLRPGRFDRILEVPAPDVDGRRDVLTIHTRGMNLVADLDLDHVATLMGDDATGADIKAICTEAGMMAIRAERTQVTLADFEAAIRKVRGDAIDHANRLSGDAAFA